MVLGRRSGAAGRRDAPHESQRVAPIGTRLPQVEQYMLAPEKPKSTDAISIAADSPF
jgi:hypothetical protein